MADAVGLLWLNNYMHSSYLHALATKCWWDNAAQLHNELTFAQNHSVQPWKPSLNLDTKFFQATLKYIQVSKLQTLIFRIRFHFLLKSLLFFDA